MVERRRKKGRVRLGVLDSHGFDDIGPFVRGVIDQARPTLHSDGLRRLPWSHVIFSNLKSWLRGTFHGVSRAYLPRYLEEFSFRYNHRSRAAELGTLVPRRVLRSKPMPLFRLRAELTA